MGAWGVVGCSLMTGCCLGAPPGRRHAAAVPFVNMTPAHKVRWININEARYGRKSVWKRCLSSSALLGKQHKVTSFPPLFSPGAGHVRFGGKLKGQFITAGRAGHVTSSCTAAAFLHFGKKKTSQSHREHKRREISCRLHRHYHCSRLFIGSHMQ